MAAVLDTTALVATPEHIAFAHRVAGPLPRVVAWLIDAVLRVVVLLVLLVIVGLLGVAIGGGVAVMIMLLAYFALEWLGGGLCEWLWNGRTPGKAMLGIRVIAADGLPPGLAACLLRNLLRVADGFPSVLTAIAAMLASGSLRRLGDLAADTLVVYADRDAPARAVVIDDKPVRAFAAQLPGDVASHVDGGVLRAIHAFAARRRHFAPARRQELARPLAVPLLRRLGLPPSTDPDLLLCAVHERLRAAGEGAGATAGRVAAMLERRRGDWSRLEQRRFAGGDRPPAVTQAALLRAVSTDLALAEAYHLPARTVDYLQRLVASAHQRFYHRVRVDWRAWWRTALHEVPRRLRADPCVRAGLAVFFGVFALGIALGAADPGLAAAYLGSDTLDQMHQMYSDAPRDRRPGEAASMTGFYVANNVSIALTCFAWGVFAGIGALVMLAAQGAYLGLVVGWMIQGTQPQRGHFLEFISAHGPFELVGIALCGAAGLRLGLGLIRPSPLTRTASLVESARQAAPVLAVAAVLVALAAPIEAFVSPSAMPVAAKRTVMGVCLALLAAWMLLGGRGAAASSTERA